MSKIPVKLVFVLLLTLVLVIAIQHQAKQATLTKEVLTAPMRPEVEQPFQSTFVKPETLLPLTVDGSGVPVSIPDFGSGTSYVLSEGEGECNYYYFQGFDWDEVENQLTNGETWYHSGGWSVFLNMNAGGGQAPEAGCYWYFAYLENPDGPYALISPDWDLSAITLDYECNLYVQFKSFVDFYEDVNTEPFYIGVYMRNDTTEPPDTYYEVWSRLISEDTGPATYSFNASEYVGSGVSLAFVVWGAWYDFDYWSVDDLYVFTGPAMEDEDEDEGVPPPDTPTPTPEPTVTPTLPPFVYPCPGPEVINGLMGTVQPGKDTFVAGGRIFRDGTVPPECWNQPKACPGNFGTTTSQYYDVWSFPATSGEVCVTIAMDTGTCGEFYVHASAWLGIYTTGVGFPANCVPGPGVSFVNDQGSSGNNSFDACIPAGTEWSILVHTNYGTAGYLGCSYTMTLSCIAGCAQPPTPTPPPGTCFHEIWLWDTFGDGWNGAAVDVYVDGILVLDNITLATGSGPGVFQFSAGTGQTIFVEWVLAGTWPTECYFDVYDGYAVPLVLGWFPYTSGNWTGTANCEPPPPSPTPPPLGNPCPGPTVLNGEMGIGQTGLGKIHTFAAAGRIFRDGTAPPECWNLPKACPGNYTGSNQYDVWAFDANTDEQCVTITMDTGSCGEFYIHASAWVGIYPYGVGFPAACDPAPGVTFISDQGSSGNNSFWACVPAGEIWSILVHTNYGSAGYIGCTYTMTLSCSVGCSQPPTPTPPPGTCAHEIVLWDTFGDGWNGGMVDVLVNGIVVLDNITLASGSGPANFNFFAGTGDAIQVIWTAGSWPGENYFDVYDGCSIALVTNYYPYTSGATWNGTGNCNCVPTPTPPAGQCEHEIWLYDSFGDGWNGCTVDVLVNSVIVLDNITLPSGSGPLVVPFFAATGDTIEVTNFVCVSWCGEPYVSVYDGWGNLLVSNLYPYYTYWSGTGSCP
jgi:hypothetical protein